MENFLEKKIIKLDFEKSLEKLANLFKEMHNDIMEQRINSREELIAAYEEKMKEAISWFADPSYEKVKSFFDRYNLILEKFDEYREKNGDI